MGTDIKIPDLTRRHFLIGAGVIGCCGGVLGFPHMTLAAAPTQKRLMVVVLRGAMDGLGAVAPVGDRYYHDARKGLVLPDHALLNLDGYFALNAALPQLHEFYRRGEMAVMHATATPYRDRSHFDAQDLLENGGSKPHALATGWLGRTLQAMGGGTGGLAVGPSVPLLLQGGKNVQSWAPSALPGVDDDFMNRVVRMYEHDDMLGAALAQARNMPDTGMSGKARGDRQFIEMMQTAATFMNKDGGARLATIDLGGWDTHAGQGTDKGRLAQALGVLNEGLAAFHTAMGPAWEDTAVLVLTEFGRTVAQNGSGGTDHGTASAAFLIGGRVAGGRVIGEWPTLAPDRLYEGRDLYPANDMRALIKAVLVDHVGVARNVTDELVFPGSASVAPWRSLFRAQAKDQTR